MRRFYSSIGVLALVAAACSGGTADTTTTTSTTIAPATTSPTTPPTTMVITPPQTTTSLDIWVPEGLVASVDNAVAAFEIDTGISVNVTATDSDELLALLIEDPEAGPDLFIGPHIWLTDLATAGIAEPMVPRDDVVGGAAAAVELRGATYAAPIGLDTVVQFRNRSLLVTAPATVESFATGCTVAGTTGPCLALAADSVEGHWTFMTGLGGYLFGPDEFAGWNKDDVGIDTTGALAGGLVLDAILDGAGILGDGDTSALDRFRAGAAPLTWGSIGDLATLRATDLDFVVEALPTIGEQPGIAPVSVTALWVNAFSDDKEAATSLVMDHLAAPENARVLAIALGLAPVDVEFSTDPDLAVFTQGARVGHPVPPIAVRELAWQELGAAFVAIREGASAEEGLRGAASSIRAEG